MIEGRAHPSLRVGDILWVALAAAFLGIRVSAAIQLPVAGAELSTLSGAWQEWSAQSDARYQGTLVQALSSPLLGLVSDAWLPRLLVLGAAAPVPLCLWLARRSLGEPVALVFLLLIAVDPAAVLMESTATAAAFDTTISIALLAAILRGNRSAFVWGALGFLVAAGGVAPAVLAGSAAVLALTRTRSVDPRRVTSFAAGAVLAVSILSLTASDVSLRVPPLDLLNAGLEEEWAGANVVVLAVLYEFPIVMGGIAAASFFAARRMSRIGTAGPEQWLLSWAAGGGLLWLAAGGAHDPSLLLTLTLPLSGLLATGLVGLLSAIPAETRATPRFSAALTLALLTAAGAAIELSGTFAVARGAHNESLISPRESASTRSLREHVLRLAAESPGGIVVHPDLEAALVWPLRESETLTVSSVVPRGDAVVVWPREAARPEGYEDSGGVWFIVRTISAPSGSPGEIVHWFRQRNQLETNGIGVRVYTGAAP